MALAQGQSTLLFIHGSADLYGSDLMLLQLVAGLDPKKFHSVVVVPYDGLLVSRLRGAGAEVIISPNLPVIRRQHMNVRGLLHLASSSLRSVYQLTSFIRRRNITLVHSNTLAVLLTGLAAKLAGRPQVWHVHEIVVHPRLVGSLLATLSSALSTVVVTCSCTAAEHYRRTRLVGLTPVRAVLNGIDESRVHSRAKVQIRSLVGAKSEDVVFTLIGRINNWKGQSVFLDAAERLARETKNVRFLIVGDSFAGQEHLTEAVDHRIESSDVLRRSVVRLSYISEVGSVYEASDVIVVPSTDPEPFSTVVLEAMAAGLPVIASRSGGLPEAIDDSRTGILVDPGDVNSLLAAMKRLSSSASQRAEMGREGRERFKRYFRVERYVEQFAQLYEEVSMDDARQRH